jgi:hypothetical protein
LESKLDVEIGAGRPRLARENQAVPDVVRSEDLTVGHIDFAPHDGGDARAATALAARVGHGDTRLEQHFGESLGTRPAEPMSPTIQIDLDVCNVRHG